MVFSVTRVMVPLTVFAYQINNVTLVSFPDPLGVQVSLPVSLAIVAQEHFLVAQ